MGPLSLNLDPVAEVILGPGTRRYGDRRKSGAWGRPDCRGPETTQHSTRVVNIVFGARGRRRGPSSGRKPSESLVVPSETPGRVREVATGCPWVSTHPRRLYHSINGHALIVSLLGMFLSELW